MKKQTILMLAIFLAVAACNGKNAPLPRRSSNGLDHTSRQPGITISGRDRAKAFVPKDIVNGSAIEILAGDSVVTEKNLALLNIQGDAIGKGNSVRFTAKKPISDAEIARVEYIIPYDGEKHKNMVVMYQTTSSSGGQTVGLIPLSYLKVITKEQTVSFKSRGLGDYQVALTTEHQPKPIEFQDGKVSHPEDNSKLDPTLSVASTTALPGESFGVGVRNNLVFVTGAYGMRIIDARDPTKTKITGGLNTGSSGELAPGRALHVIQTNVWQADISGIAGIDVFNPAAPGVFAGRATRSNSDITGSGGLLFLANDIGLLAVIISQSPIQLGHQYTFSGGCSSVDMNSEVIVATCKDGIQALIVDLPPAQTIRHLNPDVNGSGVRIAGRYAYVVGSFGLKIFDIAEVSAIKLVGELAGGSYSAVDVHKNMAYVLTGDKVIGIDVSDPTLPKETNLSLGGLGSVRDIRIYKDLAYIVAADQGLHIVKGIK